MAAESVSNNVPLSNGNVPTPAPSMTPPKPALSTSEGLLTTIILTIYDVIVFLAVSIGYIFQVSRVFFLIQSNIFQLAHQIMKKFSITHTVRTPFKNLVIKTFIRMDSIRTFVEFIYLICVKRSPLCVRKIIDKIY